MKKNKVFKTQLSPLVTIVSRKGVHKKLQFMKASQFGVLNKVH